MTMLEVKNFLMVYQALMKTGIGSLPKPEVVQSPNRHEKKPALLSMKYWLVNRDPYFMVYSNPNITG